MYLVLVKDGDDTYLADSYFTREYAQVSVERMNESLFGCGMVAYLLRSDFKEHSPITRDCNGYSIPNLSSTVTDHFSVDSRSIS